MRRLMNELHERHFRFPSVIRNCEFVRIFRLKVQEIANGKSVVGGGFLYRDDTDF